MDASTTVIKLTLEVFLSRINEKKDSLFLRRDIQNRLWPQRQEKAGLAVLLKDPQLYEQCIHLIISNETQAPGSYSSYMIRL